MQPLNFSQRIGNSTRRKRNLEHTLEMRGFFSPFELWRGGKLITSFEFFNGITNVGKNLLLEVMFRSGTQVATASWVMGLIDATSYTALAATDTMASHAGWQEFTNYSEGTRPAWGQGTVSSQAISNATPVTFTISATGTLVGIFITTNATKGGTTGTLWSTGAFPSGNVPVVSGDEIRSSYGLSC